MVKGVPGESRNAALFLGVGVGVDIVLDCGRLW